MMHSATKWQWNDRDLKYDEVPDPDAETMSCKEEEKPDIAMRLIDANALREGWGSDYSSYPAIHIIEWIDAAPTVRCGECRHDLTIGTPLGGRQKVCRHSPVVWVGGELSVMPDGFGCSYFEVKP